MAQPEPNYEDEDLGLRDDVTDGSGAVEKPDWLVGAHEALEAEFGRDENDLGHAPPELRAAPPEAPRQPTGPRPVNPYEGFATSAAGRASTSNWMESGPAAPASYGSQAEPAPEEEIDPDDPFGHGRAREEAGAAGDELAGPETPAAVSEKARWSPPPPPKPWLEPLVARVFSLPGLIMIGVVVVALIARTMFFGPKDNSVSLSKIRHNATAYDGQLVQVRGRVGEVYPVGGGYSFYLLQGRDTMVVFTRTRTPVTSERVSVSGVISTGVLNGEVRQALLESAP
jgi:hypothetical protein